MKNDFLLCFFVISLFFAFGCSSGKSPVKPFESVEKQTKETGKEYKKTYASLCANIRRERKNNAQLALSAETVRSITNEAIHFIDSISEVLKHDENAGKNPEALLVEPKGNGPMTQKLLKVYDCCYANVIDTASRLELGEALNGFDQFRSNPGKTRELFANIPLPAALLMLAALRNNCLDGAIVTLQDIKDHLKNK